MAQRYAVTGRIKVEARMDNMGNIMARPVSDRWAKRFAKRCNENGGSADLEAFFQDGMVAHDFMEDMTPGQRRDLNNGYTVRFFVDPWIVGHWYGYDAHTAAE